MQNPPAPDGSIGFMISSLSLHVMDVVSVHEGGFGRVYIVDTVEGSSYALKTLKWELGLKKSELVDEASRLVDLPFHPNVAEVVSLVWLDDSPYIVMNRYEGTLRSEMLAEGWANLEVVRRRVLEIATGLNHLHSHSILHLDLKPENVLWGELGTGKDLAVSDFGLARALPRQPGTPHDQLFVQAETGTVAYMSPEHYTTGHLTAKTDVFALGIIFYELLTGAHPFLGETREETEARIVYHNPTLAERSIDGWDELSNLCLACLSKDPSSRPFADDVIRFLHGNVQLDPGPTSRGEIVARVSVLLGMSRLEEAQKDLEDFLKKEPGSADALSLLATVQFNLGDASAAVTTGEKALVALAQDHAPIGSIPGADAERLGTICTNLSFAYLFVDPAKALSTARRAVEANGDDWQALGNVGEACRILNESSYSLEILNEGFEACTRAMALAPEELNPKITYGYLLLGLGRIDTVWPFLSQLMTETDSKPLGLKVLFIEAMIAKNKLVEAEEAVSSLSLNQTLAPVVERLDKLIARKKGGAVKS